MAKATTTIHDALAAIQEESDTLMGMGIVDAYTDLVKMLKDAGISYLPSTASHAFEVKSTNGDMVGITTVDVEYGFRLSDSNPVFCHAVGIFQDTHGWLTNYTLFMARACALLSVFDVVASDGVTSIPTSLPTQPPAQPGNEVVNQLLQQHGQQSLKTADQIAPITRPPSDTLKSTPSIVPASGNRTKLGLAEDAKALLAWQNKIVELSPENPGDWDEHAQALGNLKGLKQEDVVDQFKKLKEQAARVNVGYNKDRRAFFLIEVPSEVAQ